MNYGGLFESWELAVAKKVIGDYRKKYKCLERAEGKLSLKEGEMADLKDKGVMYKVSIDEPAELVEDKLDVMARCMIRLVKELQEVKSALSLLASKPKD